MATECASALAVDTMLQMQLLRAGCLWQLLLFMFGYDFTLDEGGVERSEEANQQEIANRLAKAAVGACARLGGYGEGEAATPPNAVTRGILEKVLTPYLAGQLGNGTPETVSEFDQSGVNNFFCIQIILFAFEGKLENNQK